MQESRSKYDSDRKKGNEEDEDDVRRKEERRKRREKEKRRRERREDEREVNFRTPELGLLRTSASSPSWIFEALVPIPKVIADVLVFVHGLRDW